MLSHGTITKGELCHLLGLERGDGSPDYYQLSLRFTPDLRKKLGKGYRSTHRKFTRADTIVLIEHFKLHHLKEVRESNIWTYISKQKREQILAS